MICIKLILKMPQPVSKNSNDPLTGQTKEMQLFLCRGADIRRANGLAIGHEEIIRGVGAPEAHETHGAVEEGLRSLH